MLNDNLHLSVLQGFDNTLDQPQSATKEHKCSHTLHSHIPPNSNAGGFNFFLLCPESSRNEKLCLSGIGNGVDLCHIHEALKPQLIPPYRQLIKSFFSNLPPPPSTPTEPHHIMIFFVLRRVTIPLLVAVAFVYAEKHAASIISTNMPEIEEQLQASQCLV